jgi:hypothetical protein
MGTRGEVALGVDREPSRWVGNDEVRLSGSGVEHVDEDRRDRMCSLRTSGWEVHAVERLDLGLLVDREHDRPLGRGEAQPDHVADLGLERRIGAELETSRSGGA